MAHSKVITKLKSVSLANLDYKKLLEKPLETIGDYLTDSNLQFFAKLLPKLPAEVRLASSKIHVIWCLKSFWSLLDDDEAEVEWTLERINGFTDKFEALNESLKKLDLETDFVEFVRETLVSQKTCARLCVQVRRNLVKKYTRFLKTENRQPIRADKLEAINKTLVKIKEQLRISEGIYKRFETDPR